MKKPCIGIAIGLTAPSYADTPTKNEIFDTALSQADHTKVKKALDEGASIDKRDPFGRTPLINAAWKGQEGIVALLLLRGADIRATDKLGSTALHKAVRSGNDKVVLLLLSERALIDAQDQEGNTPLPIAAQLNDPMMIKLLIKNQANVELLDDQGRTAEQRAMAEQRYNAIEMFKTMKEAPGTPLRKRKRNYKDVVKILRAQ